MKNLNDEKDRNNIDKLDMNFKSKTKQAISLKVYKT